MAEVHDVLIFIHVTTGPGAVAMTDWPLRLGAAVLMVWLPAAQEERIAFDLHCNGQQDIYTVRPDGSGMRRLTHAESGSLASSPAWAPDGETVAFHVVWISGDRHRSEIFLMNADGTGRRQITHTANGKSSWHASWSPNGKRLAFASDREGNHEIYTMAADGSDVRRLTSTPGKGKHSWNPAWSPHGGHIAFDSNRSGKDEIYTVEVPTRKVARLTRTRGAAGSWTPDWAPDGRVIVFTSNRRGRDEHYLMGADGSAQRPLNLEAIGRPRWAPDGTRLVYQVKSPRADEEKIVISRAQDGPVTLIDKPGCLARHPDWCCRGPAALSGR